MSKTTELYTGILHCLVYTEVNSSPRWKQLVEAWAYVFHLPAVILTFSTNVCVFWCVLSPLWGRRICRTWTCTHFEGCCQIESFSGSRKRKNSTPLCVSLSPRRRPEPSWPLTARPWATLWGRRTSWRWSSTARRWSTLCPLSCARPSWTWRCPARLSSAAGREDSSITHRDSLTWASFGHPQGIHTHFGSLNSHKIYNSVVF